MLIASALDEDSSLCQTMMGRLQPAPTPVPTPILPPAPMNQIAAGS